MNNNINLLIGSLANFTVTTAHIIQILSQVCNLRCAIIMKKNISHITNLKATLWYTKGYSYPHVDSDNPLAIQSKIVIAYDINYLYQEPNFQILIFCHYKFNIQDIIKIKSQDKQKQIFIIENEDNIKEIQTTLIQNNIPCFIKKDNNYINSFNTHSTNDEESAKILKINMEEQVKQQYPLSNTHAIFIIKPRVIKIKQEFMLLHALTLNGFYVSNYYKRKITAEVWADFYSHVQDKPFFQKMCTYLGEEFVGIAKIYGGKEVYTRLRNIIGPTDPADCKSYHLRYQYGLNLDDNGMHCSDSFESYQKEMQILTKIVRV